jgi:hypothetical protein
MKNPMLNVDRVEGGYGINSGLEKLWADLSTDV